MNEEDFNKWVFEQTIKVISQRHIDDEDKLPWSPELRFIGMEQEDEFIKLYAAIEELAKGYNIKQKDGD
jgi:hypothetical protein